MNIIIVYSNCGGNVPGRRLSLHLAGGYLLTRCSLHHAHNGKDTRLDLEYGK